MHEIDLRRIDLNLLVVFDVLMAERNVTRAAERLARTQSAVSHALARLREQVGDPLLVKVNGRMTASPFAERLIEDVRPILSGIRRVLAPPRPFDPATSTRTFRVTLPDITPSLFPRLAARVRAEAPEATLEWVARSAQALAAVAEGQVDLAHVPAATRPPEGTEGEPAGALKWASFARRDHPAVRRWGRRAWAEWPHVVVGVSERMPSPVAAAAGDGEGKRRVAVRVPHFSAVAPLLACTDLLATLPLLVMHDSLDAFGLIALPTPFPVEPMPHRLIWSARLAGDPALRWIRAHVQAALKEVFDAAERVPVRARPRQS